MDAFSSMPLDEIPLLQPWVAFQLVHRGSDGAGLQQVLHLLFGTVRYPDGFRLSGMVYLLHRFVCLWVLSDTPNKQGPVYIRRQCPRPPAELCSHWHPLASDRDLASRPPANGSTTGPHNPSAIHRATAGMLSAHRQGVAYYTRSWSL